MTTEAQPYSISQLQREFECELQLVIEFIASQVRALSPFLASKKKDEVGIDIDEKRLQLFMSQVDGKDISEFIASGRQKSASVPSGGGGGGGGASVAVAAGGAAASAREEMTSPPETPSIVPAENRPPGMFSTPVQVQSSLSGGTSRHPCQTPPDSNTLQNRSLFQKITLSAGRVKIHEDQGTPLAEQVMLSTYSAGC
ncbi:hypothetical protein KSS87_015263 [Heliosperma pusillum]|nr:hypothetical protein KSS87_015263 [Heliosperma pusillum]